MSENIEPALDAHQWEQVLETDGTKLLDFASSVVVGFAHDLNAEGRGVMIQTLTPPAMLFLQRNVAGLIAVANAAFLDSDPRKITREKIELLRMARIEEAEGLDDPDATAALQAFADALESYLPPEKD